MCIWRVCLRSFQSMEGSVGALFPSPCPVSNTGASLDNQSWNTPKHNTTAIFSQYRGHNGNPRWCSSLRQTWWVWQIRRKRDGEDWGGRQREGGCPHHATGGDKAASAGWGAIQTARTAGTSRCATSCDAWPSLAHLINKAWFCPPFFIILYLDRLIPCNKSVSNMQIHWCPALTYKIATCIMLQKITRGACSFLYVWILRYRGLGCSECH